MNLSNTYPNSGIQVHPSLNLPGANGTLPYDYMPGQPGVPMTQPGMNPGQPFDPANPIQPGAGGMTPDPANGSPAMNTPPIVQDTGNAGADDFGNQFDLTSQFAGRGEASGVRDLTIGDFFSGTGAIQFAGREGQRATTIPIAGGDRRRKVSDHFSPIPVNRTYFSYHNFGDAVNDSNGNQGDVKRFSLGVERMFLNNNASFEIRVPFVHGLNNTQIQDDSMGIGSGTEFGNITLASKYLLMRNQRFAVSAGVSSIIPTAADAEVQDDGGLTIMAIENEAIDVIPYMSFYFRPNQNSWMTFTTQLDFNVKGNTIIADPGTSFETQGEYNDQNLFSMDLSTGRWLYNNHEGNNLVRGIAAIFELHYTTTLNDSDVVTLGNATVSNPFNRTDTLNSTIGLRMQLRERTFATIAGVFPFRGGEDRPFENEFNFNISRLY